MYHMYTCIHMIVIKYVLYFLKLIHSLIALKIEKININIVEFHSSSYSPQAAQTPPHDLNGQLAGSGLLRGL